MNDNANRDLKYLLEQLRASTSEPEKAKSLLHYLSGCAFNAGESPDRIIRFSNDEATELARYVAEINANDVDGVEEPGVRQILLQTFHNGFCCTKAKLAPRVNA